VRKNGTCYNSGNGNIKNSFQAENIDKMMQTNERAKVRNRIQTKRGEDMELRETILEGTIQAFNKIRLF
jgi:hypothetical protein